ncbi:unnamed protein product [Closterium sp. NIES-54]
MCCSSAATAATAAMASPTVLTFDVDFDVWVDDLQLFLQCDSRDGVCLFDHTSGVSTTPAATTDSTARSQWTTRDAVARLAVRSHLPPAERAHFGQYKSAMSLYDGVVARYSSPATTALSRLMLPYLFPDLAAFAKVADLITRHVITVKNRVLTHVGDKHWVLYERWLGKKPSIDMLRVWGCMGLVMVPKEQRHKLEVAAVWAVHLGMAPDSKGWLMWDPSSGYVGVWESYSYLPKKGSVASMSWVTNSGCTQFWDKNWHYCTAHYSSR